VYRFDELAPGATLRITSSAGQLVDIRVRGAGRAWLDVTLAATGENATLVCIPWPYDDNYKRLVAQGGVMQHATAFVEPGATATLLTSNGNVAFSVAAVELL